MEGVYLLCQTTHDTEKYFASATFTPLLKKLLCCVEEYLSCHCSLVINYLYFLDDIMILILCMVQIQVRNKNIITQITNDYLELYQTMQIEFDLSENNKNLICILFCLTLFHCIWLYLWCMRQLNYEINTHWFDMEFEMNNKIQMHDINCLPLHSAVWEMSVKRLEGRDKTETIVNMP